MTAVDVPESAGQQVTDPTAPTVPATAVPSTALPPTVLSPARLAAILAVGWRWWIEWARPAAATLGPVLAVHAATRAITLGMLAWMAAARDMNPWPELAKADGTWYLSIIEHGYTHDIAYRADGSPATTNLAFFPGYPLLSRAVADLTGLSPYGAGLAVTAVAGIVASVAIYLIGRDLLGHRGGLVLVALWSAGPVSVVLSMVYTEALFTAFAATSLLAVMRRRWLTAATLCVLAGLTRSTAVALVAAIAAAALVAAARRQDGWRPYAAAALAPLGVLGYWAWVGGVLGRPDGWFWLQSQAWHTRFDFGAYTLRTAGRFLTNDGFVVWTACALIVAASVALWLLMLADRPPLLLAVYATGMLILAIGTRGFLHSEPRYLFPAFPLLLPVAAVLAKLPVRSLVIVLATAALGSAWFGSFLLIAWHWAL
jgi:hypothetical protein